MAGIFISWGSADKTIAQGVVSRLRGLGLDPPAGSDLPRVLEYSHDMEAGDNIPQQVMEWINQSTIAVLCLSDATLARPWIITEAAWCTAARENGSLKHIVPVQVGPLSKASLDPIKHLIPPSTAFVADVSGGAEDELVKLGRDIFNKLGRQQPKLLPIAVISMNDKEAEELFTNWSAKIAAGDDKPLWEICAAVGMQGPPAVFQTLKERYGPNAEDMMPFGTETLAQIIYAGIAEANRVRADRPVFPRWIHGELTAPEDTPTRRNARDIWRANDSVLIIDSLSIFNDKASKRLSLVPPHLKADDERRVAAVCLPPYTRRTGLLDQALQDLVNKTAYIQLEPLFKAWAESAERTVTFDMSTRIALRSWLYRKLLGIPKDDQPLGAAVNAMGNSQFKGSPGATMTSR